MSSLYDKNASGYDAQRRKVLPCFDEFYHILEHSMLVSQDTPQILELGCGTGILTERIVKKFPNAVIHVIDQSQKMLEIAREKLRDNRRIIFQQSDFMSCIFETNYDLIVSSLAIHHLSHYDKVRVYQKCFNHLNHGGSFINGDKFRSSNIHSENHIQALWTAEIVQNELKHKELEELNERKKNDKPATVLQNLRWLKRAGFAHADLIYKYLYLGIVYAVK